MVKQYYLILSTINDSVTLLYCPFLSLCHLPINVLTHGLSCCHYIVLWSAVTGKSEGAGGTVEMLRNNHTKN